MWARLVVAIVTVSPAARSTISIHINLNSVYSRSSNPNTRISRRACLVRPSMVPSSFTQTSAHTRAVSGSGTNCLPLPTLHAEQP
jgi:hypothetical protein